MKLTCVDSIFFDLDGTLWDCYEVLREFWKKELSVDFKRTYMGLNLQEMSQETGLSQDCIEEAQKRENFYISHKNPKIYDGVIDGIKKLSKKYKLFIVSNCQKGYIDIFLDKSGLTDYITDFRYSTKSKSSNIDDIVDKYGLKNPILIGDTISDLKAAKNSNILFIQSCYGFGAPIYNKSVNSFDEFLTAMEKGEI